MRRMKAAGQTMSGSYHNLQALLDDDVNDGGTDLTGGGPLSSLSHANAASRTSLEAAERQQRLIIVANHLPVIAARDAKSGAWSFELDPDNLLVQAKEGIYEAAATLETIYVGCLGQEVPLEEQEHVAALLMDKCRCCPVFMSEELRQKFYKGFCKQQLWPLLHYVLPMSPLSPGRFDAELWQSYVRANMEFCQRLTEIVSDKEDFVWIHDYHLLVLPSLLRRRFHAVRCGLFLHSPFPSSEIFRTFPKRDEVLRSLLNADLIGFHTFDYARHFLSCCSRLLGLEHETSRGSIILEYYGRRVGIKIMPTGVQPSRMLGQFEQADTQWRQGELAAAYEGQTVLVGTDDLDAFKGIELKLQAVERVLDTHEEWRGRLVLVQITNAPRSSGADVAELHAYVRGLVDRINNKHGDGLAGGYRPVVYLERAVPRHERCAFYSSADVAVVTATRDGMNLAPYEYIVCRQGPDGPRQSARQSMLVVSEFVGCSPSLSGAIRVNPWSIESVADGIYSAIKVPTAERALRHAKHWKYVSEHTVAFWASSFVRDLQALTSEHFKMKAYPLGLGLNTFRLVALDAAFRKLDTLHVLDAYHATSNRIMLLDYDGTLTTHSEVDSRPSDEVMRVLRGLADDPANVIYIISGRCRADLSAWFDGIPSLGLAAEHGFYLRAPGEASWTSTTEIDSAAEWKEVALPILQIYTESTDGSHIETKESALVWHYKNADPDFGHWQAKELLDHLDSVLQKTNEHVEVVSGQNIVEVKPRGTSKGQVAEELINKRQPDFALCIGNDRSDEDMFTAMEHVTFLPHMPAEVFPCTVGQKPSSAKFYLNDPADVVSTLAKLYDTQRPSETRATYNPQSAEKAAAA